MGILRRFCLILYYLVGRHLPGSEMPYSFGSRYFRALLCKGIFEKMGKGVNIEHGAFFGSGADIQLGDYSGLGLDCRVMGPLIIGKNVMMGPEVMIFTSNHNINRTDIPMIKQGNTDKKPVVIQDDVWIAARAIILPGVTVGRGSVIAAGAVVTKDVPEYAVVAGVPARMVKKRDAQYSHNEYKEISNA